MRNKDKKQHKGQESTIGKIIYGFLLFMPLLAIGFSCLTCLWNKEVAVETQVAEIEYKYKSNEVTNVNRDLQIGNIYNFSIDQTTYTSLSTNTTLISGSKIWIFYETSNKYVELYENVTLYKKANNQIQIKDGIDSTYYTTLYGNPEYPLKGMFIYNGYIPQQFTITYCDYNEIKSVNIETINQDLDVKNIFYIAVDKVTQSPLFNWAQNSLIYTTTNATCNALSITTPFIPLLMSYWLIISVIYFLYDIALMLVWLIHHKIHELQESL